MWLFGLFFASIGALFVYGALGGYSNYFEITPWIIALHLFFGLSGIGVGFWVVFLAPVIRMTIDRNSETVRFKRRGILGGSEIIYRFDQISQFFQIKEDDSEGDSYLLAMELSDKGDKDLRRPQSGRVI